MSLEPNCLKTYRPVYLSCQRSLGKKSVISQLLDRLNTNNLLDPHQPAYRTGHSTETALLKVVNDFLTDFYNEKICILSLLDLSAAFDTVDHETLLSRLESSHGICNTALAW